MKVKVMRPSRWEFPGEFPKIVHAWLLATNDKGVTGWIPAECVASVNE